MMGYPGKLRVKSGGETPYEAADRILREAGWHPTFDEGPPYVGAAKPGREIPRTLYGRQPYPQAIREQNIPLWLVPVRAVAGACIVGTFALGALGVRTLLFFVDGLSDVVDAVRS